MVHIIYNNNVCYIVHYYVSEIQCLLSFEGRVPTRIIAIIAMIADILLLCDQRLHGACTEKVSYLGKKKKKNWRGL